jgi:hypothetical protein
MKQKRVETMEKGRLGKARGERTDEEIRWRRKEEMED